ncbi:hypothetical protein NAT51_16040 [Flavobacterium amniphilum]|uniref:hypothetical protein n=1 Tax=Flavobacterium amniphilum TaxID=1834035 RepID=UPI00202A0B13|nr:hypothetical protein [Flavobacterium amniphilum]MCL9807046.1 hypothetical protein [Flavobacterium amniphilum]
MKAKENFKSVLGIPQEDIAVLLGVTRTQWSMYELGQRSLPVHAMLELGNMMEYIQQPKFQSKELQSVLREEEEQSRKAIQKEMETTQYKMLVLGKKIKEVQRLRNENLAALRLAAYLETQTPEGLTHGMGEVIKVKALAMFKKYNGQLEKFQLRSATLKQHYKAMDLVLKSKRGEPAV